MSKDNSESDTEQESGEKLTAVGFSQMVRDHQNRYIGVADNKASILLSGLVAYLGLSLTVIGSNFTTKSELFAGAGVLSVISAIVGIYYAASAVYPNTPETPQGLIMWESITSNSIETYRETIRGKDSDELLDELIDENYKLAQVNNRKYQLVRRALLATIPTVGFGILAMALLAS